MQVERLQVEEGFLAGLDIQFVPGLNVLIGERGTGKTSVIELLRFALGTGWFTEDARTRGHQQAIAVLGDGRVSVTAFDGIERITLTRTAEDDRPRPELAGATVLAQNEIEALGVQPAGRLRLLDRFRQDRHAEDNAPIVVAKLRATTAEVQGLLQELDSLEERRSNLQSVPAELEQAVREQAALLSSVAATKEQRKQLASLQSRQGQLSVRADALGAGRDHLQDYLAAAEALARTDFYLDEWPSPAGDPDLLEPIRNELNKSRLVLLSVAAQLAESLAEVEKIDTVNADTRQLVEEEARSLRVTLNRLQEGAGAITKKFDDLRERKGQLDALLEMRAARSDRLQQLIVERDSVYDQLDELRDRRFTARKAVADSLTAELGPSIRISVTRSASTGSYVQELINALRGSGLHYNRVAPRLAQEMTPLEVVTAAELVDTAAMCAATDLPEDRALALLTHLRHSSLADLIGAPIDDGVTMELLDGLEFKPTDRLSIGQRCTVVLPMLLTASDAVLVVDQPEDHLDNAYVTSTLVGRLRARGANQQLIFSSHNPNIPVLGDADQVAVMGSDGRRAFKLHQGPLSDPTIVAYVTSLMEGGSDAFRKRAAFYAQTWEQ